jgi:hypothetical protein
MDTLKDLQVAVQETSAALDQYRISDDTLADLEARARKLRRPGRWAFAGMLQALLDVAAQHRQECGAPVCQTCASIRYGLASTLAGLRVLVDEEQPRLRRTA